MADLKFEELEKFYETLAKSIDQVGKDNESLFLTRLAMTMANSMPDSAQAIKCIEISIDGYE